MAAAATAMHLGACHEQAAVAGGADGVLQRRVEAGPAGAAVELGGGGEEGQIAAGAGIGAGAVLLVQGAGAGALGAVLAQHVVLLGREQLLPFLLALGDLEGGGCCLLGWSRNGEARGGGERGGGNTGERKMATVQHWRLLPRVLSGGSRGQRILHLDISQGPRQCEPEVAHGRSRLRQGASP